MEKLEKNNIIILDYLRNGICNLGQRTVSVLDLTQKHRQKEFTSDFISIFTSGETPGGESLVSRWLLNVILLSNLSFFK